MCKTMRRGTTRTGTERTDPLICIWALRHADCHSDTLSGATASSPSHFSCLYCDTLNLLLILPWLRHFSSASALSLRLLLGGKCCGEQAKEPPSNG